MSTIQTKDGTEIFYKDWGPKDAQPIVFHHGWPLSADDWDTQMMFFLEKGFRVIAHDRRGHGRSSQTDTGNEMDTYAADLVELAAALDLKNAIHVGHSTGGGEVAHYVARAERGRVVKAVLIGAVPPVMVKSAKNPGGLPIEVFDGLRAALLANRAQFYVDVPTGPFYSFNRSGAKVIQGVIDNWWRQGMMGGAKAHYDCIKAFSETDFTEDLKKIDVPVLVMHGTDDQIVPYADSAPLVGQAAQEGHAQDLPGFAARHVHDPRRCHQPGPAGVRPQLTTTGRAVLRRLAFSCVCRPLVLCYGWKRSCARRALSRKSVTSSANHFDGRRRSRSRLPERQAARPACRVRRVLRRSPANRRPRPVRCTKPRRACRRRCRRGRAAPSSSRRAPAGNG